LVKYGSSIGAGSIIICGITIGEFALIGAGSVVARDVPPHALVYGNPALQHGFVCRCARRLSSVMESDGRLKGLCETCGQVVFSP
ncbi:MAG TPA: N-acetyltransferase, partial [Ktedonobacteraceae bacterium]|nr:N-acetyltransferase [Ktedonobacteraceae bacterium]